MNRIQRSLLKVAGLSWLVDAANFRERLQRPYEILTTGSIPQEINLSDLQMLISDSRKLYCNLGPLKAAIDDKAMYSVGRAWSAKSRAKDRTWAKKAEKWINEQWYPMADARGNMFDFKTDLFLASVSIDRDGEIFILLTESEDGWPQIQLLPTTMIGQRGTTDGERLKSGPYAGLRMIQGVVFNEVGRAVAFQVLGTQESEDQFYSARDVIQIFDPQWADQVHGFPAFMHALLDLKDLRTMQGYERIAAMLASSVGLIENNELGAPDASDPSTILDKGKAFIGPSMPDVITKQETGVTTRFFRAGSGGSLTQLKSERPGDAVDRFMNRLIRNGCAGANWPYELTWDSSLLGGANIRLVVAKAMRSVEDRQDLLRPVARRIVGYATAKAIKKGLLEDNEEWYAWDFGMPARMTTDYGRDANADREDYAAGLTTLTEILDEQGRDLDQFIEEKKAEQQKLRDAGLADSEEDPTQ